MNADFCGIYIVLFNEFYNSIKISDIPIEKGQNFLNILLESLF